MGCHINTEPIKLQKCRVYKKLKLLKTKITVDTKRALSKRQDSQGEEIKFEAQLTGRSPTQMNNDDSIAQLSEKQTFHHRTKLTNIGYNYVRNRIAQVRGSVGKRYR
jgi:hypothetical protein